MANQYNVPSSPNIGFLSLSIDHIHSLSYLSQDYFHLPNGTAKVYHVRVRKLLVSTRKLHSLNNTSMSTTSP